MWVHGKWVTHYATAEPSPSSWPNGNAYLLSRNDGPGLRRHRQRHPGYCSALSDLAHLRGALVRR